MRTAILTALLAAALAVVLFAFGPSINSVDPSAAPSATPRQTPADCYNDHRDAVAKRDQRRIFACLTPAAQDNAAFEAVFACNMKQDDPKVLALLKRFAIDEASIGAQYARRQTPNATVIDQSLVRQVILDQLTSKAEFYAAAADLLAAKAALPTPGALYDLTIAGDIAQGKVDNLLRHLESTGGPSQWVSETITTTIEFRNIDGRWLIESFAAQPMEAYPVLTPPTV